VAYKNEVTFHRAELRESTVTLPAAAATPKRPVPAGGGGGGKATAQRKTIQFEGKQWNTSLAKEATVETFKGKTALHVQGREQTYVYLPDVEFRDGTIEADIAGATFSGIAFRGRNGGRRAEKLYFRPQNAGTAKHKKSVQYAVIGRKDASWSVLRAKFPG